MENPEEADLQHSPEHVIRMMLPGLVRQGARSWEGRRDPLVNVLGLMAGGQPALIVSGGKDTELLQQACAGRAHYPRNARGEIQRDNIEKDHPWSDLIDALCYVVGGMKPWRALDRARDGSWLTPEPGLHRVVRGPLQPAILEGNDPRVRLQYPGQGPNGYPPARLE
jgi:hypothetical protein